MKLPPLILFAGAAVTGKTVVMNKVAEKLNLVKMPSPVRDFFHNNNLENEQQLASKPPSEQFAFQTALFFHFSQRLDTVCREAGKRGVICDRSLFDHYAYCIYCVRDYEHIALRGIQFLQDNLHDFMLRMKPRIFYFPYPMPWSDKTDYQDGFRFTPPGKNTIIDALIISRLARYIPIIVPDYSIEDRVEWICNGIKGDPARFPIAPDIHVLDDC